MGIFTQLDFGVIYQPIFAAFQNIGVTSTE